MEGRRLSYVGIYRVPLLFQKKRMALLPIKKDERYPLPRRYTPKMARANNRYKNSQQSFLKKMHFPISSFAFNRTEKESFL